MPASSPFDDFQSTAAITPASPAPGKTFIAPDDLTGTEDALDTKALAAAATGTATAQTTKPAANKPTTTKVKADKRTRAKKAAKPSTKRSALLEPPSQTIDAAIAAGMPPKKLDALLKAWSEYNEHQALLKARAETAALANAISDRRRVIANKLLALADSLGVSVAEARKIFADELEAQRRGKSK